MRRLLAAVLLLFALTPLAQAQTNPFTRIEAFATKTGFRGIFAWQASEPVSGFVRWGTSPATLDQIAGPIPGTPDKAGMAVAHFAADGNQTAPLADTIYYQVVDDLTGAASTIASLATVNSYRDWNGSAYTIDLLVALDSQSAGDLPADLNLKDIAAGVNILAERIFDATDGFARIGNVLVTDTNLDYAVNAPSPLIDVPACFVEQSNLADVLVQTTIPFDSHTFGGFAINDPCTSFYVGRLGQLVVPWDNDLHLGYVSAHELMHYAFNAPDLYAPFSAANCTNSEWDGSLMHNTGGWNGTRWRLTELDRNATLTPCDHANSPYTWNALRQRYTNVPERPNGPIENIVDTKARGNPDGGALNIMILDREPGVASSLTSFVPLDTPLGGAQIVCAPDPGEITDPVGDTNFTPEPSLDLTKTDFTWSTTGDLTVRFKVADLTPQPPQTAAGHYFELNFRYGATNYNLSATRHAAAFRESRTLSNADTDTTLASNLGGSFDSISDEITIVLPAAVFNQTANPAAPLTTGSKLTNLSARSGRLYVALIAFADTANGDCAFPLRLSSWLDLTSKKPGAMITGLNGRLTVEGNPVKGRLIQYFVDNAKIGQEVTDARGDAPIKVRPYSPDGKTTKAVFGGDASYRPAEDAL